MSSANCFYTVPSIILDLWYRNSAALPFHCEVIASYFAGVYKSFFLLRTSSFLDF